MYSDVDSEMMEAAIDAAPIGIVVTDPGRDDNPIVYANSAFERLTGYPREEILGRNCRFLQGDESNPEAIAQMRRAIDEGTSVTVEVINYTKEGDQFWNEVTIAPIESYGEITHFVGFQKDISMRKEAELAERRRTDELERLIDRIYGLIEDVTEGLMRSRTRFETERWLANRIADEPVYCGCWIGTVTPSETGIEPRFGGGSASIADLDMIAFESYTEFRTALDEKSIQVLPTLDTPAFFGFDESTESVAIGPLVYDDRVYGIIAVGVDTAASIDRTERIVIDILARTISIAINAAESRRAIVSDAAVIADLSVPIESSPLRSIGGYDPVTYHGSVAQDGGEVDMFFTVNETPQASNTSELSENDDIVVVHDYDDVGLMKLTLPSDSFVGYLADRGAKLVDLTFDDGQVLLEVAFSPGSDARGIVDAVKKRYPECTLRSVTEEERPPTSKEAFLDGLEQSLTSKQRTAVQLAYLGGYYDSDRSITGEALASSMDISRSTYHQHLRAAERKLIGEFLSGM